ncbi:MAG: DUF4340 domain-containing protein, partial [Eubacteriales bacterium]|nr:DUF4340 domain-containing protein [Eubacteriales bacterium]
MGKKNIRLLLAGICLILVLGAGYAGISIYTRNEENKQTKEQEEKEQNSIILSIDKEQISELSVEHKGETLVFQKKETGWETPEDSAFEMNPVRIEQMLKDLSGITAARTIEAQGDLKDLGLGEEATCITVGTEDGKQTKIFYGMRNPSTHELYVQLDENAKDVYLTSQALERHFGGTLKDFAKYEEFPKVAPENMRIFRVEKEDSYVLDMPGDANCTVTDGDGSPQPANLNLVGVIQNNLANSDWADHVEYHCEDFAKYGLENPTAVIHVTYEENEKELSFDLTLGDLDEKENYYVRLDDSLQVHTVRKEYLKDFVESNATSFWSLTYSFVSIGDLDHMTVTVNGTTSEIIPASEEGQDNTKAEWMLNGTHVDSDLFKDFYYSCVGVTAQERLPKVPEFSEQPALELTYYLTDGSSKTIQYYEDGQSFYTAVYEDGTKAAHTNKLYVNEMLEKYENKNPISVVGGD